METFDGRLQRAILPVRSGKIIAIAPLNGAARSLWLALAEDGCLSWLDADTLALEDIEAFSASSTAAVWQERSFRRGLHVSAQGDLAAIVNDQGRFGQVLDLRSGQVTMELDGGEYHQDTVPFSFAFAEVQGRPLAIHRTDWNRLDVSDPLTGALLTERGPTRYDREDKRPEHYLDYFHGALRPSPDGTRILDDGWVWQPSGVPSVWSLERWISENVWESEDGPSRKVLCDREGWDQAVAWIDDRRIVVGGLDEDRGVSGDTAIFELPEPDAEGAEVRELFAFPGATGTFFCDGVRLFSVDREGLYRWDLWKGERTGHLRGFYPDHHHQGARELAQLIDGVLLRLDVSEPSQA